MRERERDRWERGMIRYGRSLQLLSPNTVHCLSSPTSREVSSAHVSQHSSCHIIAFLPHLISFLFRHHHDVSFLHTPTRTRRLSSISPDASIRNTENSESMDDKSGSLAALLEGRMDYAHFIARESEGCVFFGLMISHFQVWLGMSSLPFSHPTNISDHRTLLQIG